LAVIDIRARAADEADTELTPEDIQAWESHYGELPEACCVAVDAGWDRHATGLHYRNADEAGTMHFPGVHVDAAQLLLEERRVVGLGVDTLSIDHGPSTDFPTHRKWLPAGRWAAEGLRRAGSGTVSVDRSRQSAVAPSVLVPELPPSSRLNHPARPLSSTAP
jgi:kynurenine formamidase